MVMGLITKLENLLNQLLLKLGSWILKCIPSAVLKPFHWLVLKTGILKNALAGVPELLKRKCVQLVSSIREKFSLQDLKNNLTTTLQSSLKRYQPKASGKNFSKLKVMLLAPFLIVSQWLHGLTAAQSILLLGFSAASLLAGINMVFSGQRMMKSLTDQGRAPASAINEELQYDRPQYYKKQIRHLEFTAFRIPVYVAEVNQLKTVDIDFNITLTNRQSRKHLSKKEFQLRDHLLLNLEPSIASFPLQEEGKEILRVKLQEEIDSFMSDNEIPGKVEELKITYILAN